MSSACVRGLRGGVDGPSGKLEVGYGGEHIFLVVGERQSTTRAHLCGVVGGARGGGKLETGDVLGEGDGEGGEG